MRTKRLQGLTLVQGGAGVEANGYVCTIYGCENHDGITLPLISKEAQLSELLNDLERRLEILEYRYSEVLDMWLTDTERLVKLLPFIIETDTTDATQD